MNDEKPLSELKRLCATSSRETVCNKLGISEQYLCDILKSRRKISERIGGMLGYKTIWIEKGTSHD